MDAKERAAKARKLVHAGGVLLDVRSPQEFAKGHPPEAKNIPVQVLAQRFADVGSKDKPVVVYCHSGGRSAMATQLLRQAGFVEVLDISTMEAWSG